jgi:hypothetical protein
MYSVTIPVDAAQLAHLLRSFEEDTDANANANANANISLKPNTDADLEAESNDDADWMPLKESLVSKTTDTMSVREQPMGTDPASTVTHNKQQRLGALSDTIAPVALFLRDEQYNPLTVSRTALTAESTSPAAPPETDKMLMSRGSPSPSLSLSLSRQPLPAQNGRSPLYCASGNSDALCRARRRLSSRLDSCIRDQGDCLVQGEVRVAEGQLTVHLATTEGSLQAIAALQRARRVLFAADTCASTALADAALLPGLPGIEHLCTDTAVVWDMDVPAEDAPLLLGPRQHVVAEALAAAECHIGVAETHSHVGAFPGPGAHVRLTVRGPSDAAVNTVRERLFARAQALAAVPRASARILVTPEQEEWLLLGAQAELRDICWRWGLALVRDGADAHVDAPAAGSHVRVVALGPALLSAGLSDLQLELLARYQSVRLALPGVADWRDLRPRADELDALARAAHCTVTLHQSGSAAESTPVCLTVSGDTLALARCLPRLDALLSVHGSSPASAHMCLALPASIRDFLCGKKDGKLAKIVRETGVHVQLHQPSAECSTLVVELIASGRADPGASETHKARYQPPHQRAAASGPVSGPMAASASGSALQQLLQARRLIEGEFPAELHFHVPETHHKRMIGHGGRTIQRIMKRYGVYVKFMGALEAAACYDWNDFLDGSDNSSPSWPIDNVVVKTPAKNATALAGIRDEIFMECCALGSADAGNGVYAIDQGALRALQRLQAANRQHISLACPSENAADLLRAIRSVPGVSVAYRCFDDSVECEAEPAALETLKKRLLSLEISRASRPERGIVQGATAPGSDAFRHFPSALFPATAGSGSPSPRLSPRWSLLLQELDDRNNDVLAQQRFSAASDSADHISPSLSVASSVSMNSLTSSSDAVFLSSPSMAVGSKLSTSSSNGKMKAFADARRRSTALFQ